MLVRCAIAASLQAGAIKPQRVGEPENGTQRHGEALSSAPEISADAYPYHPTDGIDTALTSFQTMAKWLRNSVRSPFAGPPTRITFGGRYKNPIGANNGLARRCGRNAIDAVSTRFGPNVCKRTDRMQFGDLVVDVIMQTVTLIAAQLPSRQDKLTALVQ
jgi:hypothetical protein